MALVISGSPRSRTLRVLWMAADGKRRSPSRSAYLDLAPFPHAAAWLERCYARPAAVATRKRFEAFVDPPHDRRPE